MGKQGVIVAAAGATVGAAAGYLLGRRATAGVVPRMLNGNYAWMSDKVRPAPQSPSDRRIPLVQRRRLVPSTQRTASTWAPAETAGAPLGELAPPWPPTCTTACTRPPRTAPRGHGPRRYRCSRHAAGAPATGSGTRGSTARPRAAFRRSARPPHAHSLFTSMQTRCHLLPQKFRSGAWCTRS